MSRPRAFGPGLAAATTVTCPHINAYVKRHALLWVCHDCGFVWLWPRPKVEFIGGY